MGFLMLSSIYHALRTLTQVSTDVYQQIAAPSSATDITTYSHESQVNQKSTEPSCSIALLHDYWTQAIGFYRLAPSDKSPSPISMTSCHRLNICNIFDKALNNFDDVLTTTPKAAH